MARSDHPAGQDQLRRWYRLGLYLVAGGLAFLGLVFLLIEQDPALAVGFAVAVGLLTGVGVMFYALS